LLASQGIDLRDDRSTIISQFEKRLEVDGDAPVTAVVSDFVDVIANELQVKH